MRTCDQRARSAEDAHRGLGAVVTGAGAAAMVATAASACCVPVLAPLLVALVGVSGAVWAARLEPYAIPILVVAGVALAYGFCIVYRVHPIDAGATCPPASPRYVQVILWMAGSVWLLALALNVGRAL